MNTEQLHLPSDYGRPRIARYGIKSSAVWIVLFAAVGFVALYGLSWVMWYFPRFGVLAAIAIVVTVPILLASTAVAAPQLLGKLAGLRSKLRWWHALWFLLYVSTLVFKAETHEATQSEAVGAWVLLRIIPEMIVGCWLLVRLYHRRDALVWTRCMFGGIAGILTTYALACTVSTLWSVYPAWTLFKSLEYTLDIAVLAAALANIRSVDEYEDLFNWTWTIFGLELAWVWLQVPLWPSHSFLDGRLKGYLPATGSNAVGASGAFFAIIALCRLLPLNRRRDNTPFYVVLFGFGMASLLLSQTRNTVAGFAVAVVVLLIVSRRTWLLGLMSALGALAWFVTPLGGLVLAFLQRNQTAEEMESMTGRAALWAFAWEEFLKHPITGMGAYAGGKFYVMTKLGSDTTTLHSDWVELLVGIGLLGVIPFLAALVGTGWFLLRGIYDWTLSEQGRQRAFEALGVLVVITVHSVFNVELTWHTPILYFVLVGYAELLRRRKKGMAPRAVPSMTAGPVKAGRY